MISHTHKCIFIHIPKCGGSSIKNFIFEGKELDWRIPDYDVLYGWCPERKIHLQHASAKQLIDSGMISKNIWLSYYKFSIVRNPWDRAYSDYLWIQNDRKVKDSFENYLLKKGKFKEVLDKPLSMEFRGDHLIPQSNFFEKKGFYSLDFVGKFENYRDDFASIKNKLNISANFDQHDKKNKKRHLHYSLFYNNAKKNMIAELYEEDIKRFDYTYSEEKKGLSILKNYF